MVEQMMAGYVTWMGLMAFIFVPAMCIIGIVEKADEHKAKKRNRRKDISRRLNVIRVLNEDVM